MKMYCLSVRNFTNTALRKTLQRLEYLNYQFVENFKSFWACLKLISVLDPSLKALCYELLRNGWDLNFHLMYQKCIDFAAESNELMFTWFGDKPDLPEKGLDLLKMLFGIKAELWIPIGVFPRFHYEKDPRMYLSFESLDIDDKLPLFREKVIKYLRSLEIKDLFVPPPDLCLKVSSSRYNDGGVVRRDFELPQNSVDCGFLYQSFNPKPLGTREVWLPDFSTKINNSFWMLIGRQFLKKEPCYPDDDPKVTYENIKERLEYFGYFDISGFGFQFPRSLLSIVAEEIVNLFPNPDIMEQKSIFDRILNSVKVQMPDGLFKYPPRGIGLGYYEDLKTIVMLAILQDYSPISVYGDQGLLLPKTAKEAVSSLREYGFIIAPGKFEYKLGQVKWSGWTMSPRHIEKPRELWEPLVSLFSARFHWERKQILRSFYEDFPSFYKSKDMTIPFQYEILFGYEFQRGDSLWNFRNSGVSCLTSISMGDIRSWAVEKLYTPKDQIKDSLVYETPFFTSWKMGDAKQFSLYRKKLYKSSRPSSTFIRDYVTPIIELHKSKKPNLPWLAKVINDQTESKLIVNHMVTSGKFTYGLRGKELQDALTFCSRARNPYESYATGGYSVKTVWRCEPLISYEHQFLMDHLIANVSLMNKYLVQRFDIHSLTEDDIISYSLHERWRPKKSGKRKASTLGYALDKDVIPSKLRYTKISFNDVNTKTNEFIKRDDKLAQGVSTLLEDMSNRKLNLVDLDDQTYESGDEDLFLENLEELE